MGYTTTFEGQFALDKKLDKETYEFLIKLSQTRRMKRKVSPEFGVEGEFYVDGDGDMGQAQEENIIDYNTPPAGQPSLWCQWTPNMTGTAIMWDGGEKFYEYIDWIIYIIGKILQPRGYVLNGEVRWQGEDSEDMGKIIVKDNVVDVKKAVISFE